MNTNLLHQSVERFSRFVRAERDLYDGDDNNRVAFSFGQIGRYLRFVAIAESRYRETNRDVVTKVRERLANLEPGTRCLSQAEIEEYEREAARALELHYEIECFVLFTKTLLDKVAHFFEDYYGPIRSASFRSHDQLCKSFDLFSTETGIDIPEGMQDVAIQLRSIVSDYRDKQITHLKNPRATHATTISGEGESQICTIMLYPKTGDKQAWSPTVSDVAKLIEFYVNHLFTLVDGSRHRSRYRLKTNLTT
jgi:hypothetical protein